MKSTSPYSIVLHVLRVVICADNSSASESCGPSLENPNTGHGESFTWELIPSKLVIAVFSPETCMCRSLGECQDLDECGVEGGDAGGAEGLGKER